MQERDARIENPDYFFFPQHRQIFEHLVQSLREGKPTEPIAFSDYLEARKALEPVGGRPYISAIYASVPSPVLADYYAEILRDKYLLREVISKASELTRVAYEEEVEVNDVLEQTQSGLIDIIIRSQQKDAIRHVSEGKKSACDLLDERFKHQGEVVIEGIATGFVDFDRMTTGLMPGDYVVIGARPSQGKTSLACNIATNMSLTGQSVLVFRDGKREHEIRQIPVGLFSLEMSYEQLWQRLLSNYAGVSRTRWRYGFGSKESLVDAKEKAEELSQAKLWIDDTPGLSVHQFRARARLMKVRFNVQVIVLDYVQIMQASKVRGGKDPRIEVNEISATLKAVAKELGIVVIACAQLNRNTEERDRFFGKPRMSDLKESGAIEQDADCVALLWRPVMHIQGRSQAAKLAFELRLQDADGKYLFTLDKETGRLAKKQELTKEQVDERDTQIKEYAELIIVKQRNGPVGNIPLRFVNELMRFEGTTEKAFSNKKEQRQRNVEPKPKPPAPAKEITEEEVQGVFPDAKVVKNGEEA
jgi:replicative DNA helicase